MTISPVFLRPTPPHTRRVHGAGFSVRVYRILFWCCDPIPDPRLQADDAIKDRVKLYRSLKQFETLAATLGKDETKSIAVIGGGFLGSELSVALAHAGRKSGVTVTQVYPEDGNMAKVFLTWAWFLTTSNAFSSLLPPITRHAAHSC